VVSGVRFQVSGFKCQEDTEANAQKIDDS
jgi:hypothetical protein